MTKEFIPAILYKPIGSLNVNDEFLTMAEANGYNTLDQMLKEPLHEIPFKLLSGYRILKELLGILEEHGLENLIED